MSLRRAFIGLDRRGLRRRLALFFLALGLPALVLVLQAYSELKWEAFHRHRVLAEELQARIDKRYLQLLQIEESRPFTDFSFLNVLGDSSANFLQRSVLASYPVATDIPGLIGYFQIDAEGRFSTPLLPTGPGNQADYGIPETEYRQRLELAQTVQHILHNNRLVSTARRLEDERQQVTVHATTAPHRTDRAAAESDERAPEIASSQPGVRVRDEQPQDAVQAAFDRLEHAGLQRSSGSVQQSAGSLGRIEALQLDQRFQAENERQLGLDAKAPRVPPKKNLVRKERSRLPAAAEPGLQDSAAANLYPSAGTPIRTFESELDRYQFSLLDSGEFVLFRNVWRAGERYIQGMLIAQQPFLQEVVGAMFREGTLARMSDLMVAYQGDVLALFGGAGGQHYFSGGDDFHGSLLFRKALSAPLHELSLLFTVTSLPAGTGGSIILWNAVVLLLVLCGGLLLMYRLGLGQIELVRQQQDFVSAVSHELKTPLTSIRMYAEMLLQGWVSDEKRQSCYRYIFHEGERLSRLIENLLRLARLQRNELPVRLEPHKVGVLQQQIGQRAALQAEHAGFSLRMVCEPSLAERLILVDPDCVTQMVINLVDNAIKFSANARNKQIEVRFSDAPNGGVRLSVRDHGPGVAGDQVKKIFRMFYRSESELTRETAGTGIGLALVQQLALAMRARVDVINRDPGAEFVVTFCAGEETQRDA